MDDKELLEVWQSEFESLMAKTFSHRSLEKENDHYIDRDVFYWLTGFLMAKRSQQSVVLPSSKSFPSIGHQMDKLGVHGYELALSDVKSALAAAVIKHTIGE